MLMDFRHDGNKQMYRVLPTQERRPAPGEPGTLSQQMTAIGIYLEASEPSMTRSMKDRLWTVCHALATDQPIRWEVLK